MTETYGVLVGIEHYPDWPRASTPGPCANAVAVAQRLLSMGVPAANLVLFLAPEGDVLGPFGERERVIADLRDQGAEVEQQADQATLDTFLLTRLTTQRPPGSRLLFYWSGHGCTHVSGERIFYCSDYSPGALQNRVFSVPAMRRHLGSTRCSCFREQLFLADVCGNDTRSELLPARFPEAQPDRNTRQLAYFATPEGGYAQVQDGIGLFTRIITDTLCGFAGWPDLDDLAQSLRQAFATCAQKPFRVDIGDRLNELPNQLVGRRPEERSDPMRASFKMALEQLVAQHRAALLQSVNALGAADRVRAGAQLQDIEAKIKEIRAQLDALE